MTHPWKRSPARAAVTRAVVGATLVWLIVTASEQAWQWGMTEVGFAHGSPEEEEKLWDCAQPPCTISSATGVTNAAVFIITFRNERRAGLALLPLMYMCSHSFQLQSPRTAAHAP
eukprot:gene30053-66512_t